MENFNDEPVNISLVGKTGMKKLTDLKTGEVINMAESTQAVGRRGAASPKISASMALLPHSYKAFKYE